jgi:hypothetical protein
MPEGFQWDHCIGDCRRRFPDPPAMALKRSDQPSDKLSAKTGGQLGRRFGLVALVLALVVGMQLGSIPWRFRREIWRLQGFLLGGLAGYVLGRLNDTGGRKDP